MDADDRGPHAQRQRVMRACAAATASELQAAIAAFGDESSASDLRAPETGLVMLRGRIGGDGAPFNTGEATVTRAVVQLASGEIGYGYLLGRSTGRARNAAIIDALAQNPSHAEPIETEFVAPVFARVAAEREECQRKAAATRVNFFTLARGEDDNP
ncbi:MAG: phosphonate C-P lyase system protein PhnG [Pseudomonadota bacterium]